MPHPTTSTTIPDSTILARASEIARVQTSIAEAKALLLDFRQGTELHKFTVETIGLMQQILHQKVTELRELFTEDRA